jgi:hypothetical protein
MMRFLFSIGIFLPFSIFFISFIHLLIDSFINSFNYVQQGVCHEHNDPRSSSSFLRSLSGRGQGKHLIASFLDLDLYLAFCYELLVLMHMLISCMLIHYDIIPCHVM